MIKVSATILTKDSQAHIREVLNSLQSLDEVIILDNGSSDETLNIAKEFKNCKVFTSKFIGFGALKNLASSYSKNSWILSIDSDEVASKELIEAISKIDFSNPKNLYKVERKNYFLGKLVKYSGWGDEHLIRIYNKNYHQFKNIEVHESIELKQDSKIQNLNKEIKHYAVDDISSFLTKINRYSNLERERELKKLHPFLIYLRASFAFFKTYIIKLGFLDGFEGFVIAISNANGVFYKYTKRYFR